MRRSAVWCLISSVQLHSLITKKKKKITSYLIYTGQRWLPHSRQPLLTEHQAWKREKKVKKVCVKEWPVRAARLFVSASPGKVTVTLASPLPPAPQHAALDASNCSELLSNTERQQQFHLTSLFFAALSGRYIAFIHCIFFHLINSNVTVERLLNYSECFLHYFYY